MTDNYTLAPRSTDPKLYAKQVAKMVQERWEFSREESVSIRRSANRWYDLYRGFIRNRAQSFRNQVHLPLLFSAIEVGVAIKRGLLFGQKPFIEFVPSGPEDAAPARRVTALVHQQFEDAKVEDKTATILRMGDITGTAPFQWSWKTTGHFGPRRQPLPTDPTGQLFEVINGNIIDFDGPWVDVVDLLDFGPAPGFVVIDEMPWAVRRYWLDLDDIRQLAQPTVDEMTGESKPPIFDLESVNELTQTQFAGESSTELDSRRSAPGSLRYAMPNMKPLDRYSKPVEILEMHGLIPDEMVPDDGQRSRLVTIGNGTVVLRNVQNPHWSGKLPFGLYSPTPDPYSIYGIGKVEPNDKLQATASRMASQRLDAVDLILDPVFIYNQLANVQTQKLFVKPGANIGVDGPPNQALMPLTPDIRGLVQGLTEIESLWRWMQFGTGVSEDAIGMSGGAGGSDRQTAREFLGKMENTQRRMVQETLHAASVILLPLAEAFRAMNAQFMSPIKQLRMLGQGAIQDPITGEMIPPDQSVTLQDVVLRYDMRAASATSLIGKSAQQQNWTVLLPALGPPLQNPLIKWGPVYRQIFKVFDQPNPDDFVNPMTPQEIMAFMVAQQAAAQTTTDEPGSNKTAGPASATGPNSDILDQMVQPQGAESYMSQGA